MADSSIKSHNAYINKAYDRINLTIPKGRKHDLQSYVDAQNTTINGLINDLLRYELGMTPDQWKTRKDNSEE